MIGCLDHPTEVVLTVLDTDIRSLDKTSTARFRGEHIGFIFQDFNLIPVLSVYENIEYPALLNLYLKIQTRAVVFCDSHQGVANQ